MKNLFKLLSCVFLFFIVTSSSSGQLLWFLNQYAENKTYRCECHCAIVYIQCKTFYCLPELIPKATCTTMFQDECSDSGFGDPCWDSRDLCEGSCGPN
ncbi:hypothetical protein APED_26085 [Acanthopleuribacter pedis]